MKQLFLFCTVALTILSYTEKNKTTETEDVTSNLTQNSNEMNKAIDKNLPTIGVLIFEGVAIT